MIRSSVPPGCLCSLCNDNVINQEECWPQVENGLNSLCRCSLCCIHAAHVADASITWKWQLQFWQACRQMSRDDERVIHWKSCVKLWQHASVLSRATRCGPLSFQKDHQDFISQMSLCWDSSQYLTSVVPPHTHIHTTATLHTVPW